MKFEELKSKILAAQDAYYNEEPIMSDAEFDMMWDEAKKLNPNDEIFTSEVGNDHTDGFQKAKHTLLMGSQSKANKACEMDDFFSKTFGPYIAQYKCDGISLELTYKDGKLAQAITRGDGCLSYDDVIETDKGIKKIGEVVENKEFLKIKGYDFASNTETWTEVTDHLINKNNFRWYDLELENGQTIRLTGNHKVWVTNKNDWIKVEDLEEGDDFITHSLKF